jgi:hypothetical protein
MTARALRRAASLRRLLSQSFRPGLWETKGLSGVLRRFFRLVVINKKNGTILFVTMHHNHYKCGAHHIKLVGWTPCPLYIHAYTSDVQSRRAPALINTCHDARFAPHVGPTARPRHTSLPLDCHRNKTDRTTRSGSNARHSLVM